MPLELPVRLLGVNDATAYKSLRDDMLALYPDAFTSDAQAELLKPASTPRAIKLGNGYLDKNQMMLTLQ